MKKKRRETPPRLTPEGATDVAKQFIREQLGKDLPLMEPAVLGSDGTWRLVFHALDEEEQKWMVVDPAMVMVRVEDASGEASFFMTL